MSASHDFRAGEGEEPPDVDTLDGARECWARIADRYPDWAVPYQVAAAMAAPHTDERDTVPAHLLLLAVMLADGDATANRALRTILARECYAAQVRLIRARRRHDSALQEQKRANKQASRLARKVKQAREVKRNLTYLEDRAAEGETIFGAGAPGAPEPKPRPKVPIFAMARSTNVRTASSAS